MLSDIYLKSTFNFLSFTIEVVTTIQFKVYCEKEI